MAGRCSDDSTKFDGTDPRYIRVLQAVIAINAAMFLIEIVAGDAAGSKALQADALDFAADTATYALSLAAVGSALPFRSWVALVKGSSLAVMGFWVLATTVIRFWHGMPPQAMIMGTVGFLALAANIASVLLLVRFREGDANVRSVWLCSRNDAIGNIAVMLAALGVWGTVSAWPDLLVAALMSGLFFWSSVLIVTQALRESRKADHFGEAAGQGHPANGGETARDVENRKNETAVSP